MLGFNCFIMFNLDIPIIVLLATSSITANEELECQQGWLKYDNTCFWLSDSKATRDNATLKCGTLESTLVTIDKKSFNTYMEQHITVNTSYWIGLKMNNIATYAWHWNTGGPLRNRTTALNWCANNIPYTGCAVMFYDRDPCVKTYLCTLNKPFICEKESSNGMSCPDNWKFYSDGTPRCYHINTDKITRMEAARYCLNIEGRLVTVPSANTKVFITNNRPTTDNTHWIGLSPYKWDDGTAYDWDNWDDEGPHIGDKCTRILYNGMWRYGNCTTDMYNFICQKEATNPPDTPESVETSTITNTSSSIENTQSSATKTSDNDSTSSITSTISMTSERSKTEPMFTNGTQYTGYGIKSTPTSIDDNYEILLYLLIGIYSAIGVTAIVFTGLLAKYISLRRRSLLDWEKPVILEVDNENLTENDDHKFYDNPDYVSVEHQDLSTSRSIISQTSGPVLSTNTHKEMETKRERTGTALKDISITQNHEMINGDVYTVVDSSRSIQMPTAKPASKEKHTSENVALAQLSDTTSKGGMNQKETDHQSSDHEDDSHVYYNNPHSLTNNADFEHDNIYDDAINVTIPASVNSDTEDDKL